VFAEDYDDPEKEEQEALTETNGVELHPIVEEEEEEPRELIREVNMVLFGQSQAK